jgi:tyrosinase
MSHYAITGIQEGLRSKDDPLRQVPLRREIDEWWASTDPVSLNQQSLFIYALNSFMQIDPTELKSYFQVAGTSGSDAKLWGKLPNYAF